MDNNTLYFMHLTKEQFDTITTKKENVLYFVLVGNEYKFYKGNQEIQISNEKMPEKLKEILQGADEDYNTFKELSEALKKNKDLISSLNTLINDKVGKTDLATKQDKLVSNQNIKTINGQEILGSGDVKVREFPEVKSYAQEFLTSGEVVKGYDEYDEYAWVPTFLLDLDKAASDGFHTDDTYEKNSFYPIEVSSIVKGAVEETDEVYKITNTFKEVKEEIARKVGKDELDKKQDTLKDKINIKTINERSILGQGNLNIREFPTNYPDNIPSNIASMLHGHFMPITNELLSQEEFYIPAFNKGFARDRAFKLDANSLLQNNTNWFITLHNPDNNTEDLKYNFNGTNKLQILKPFEINGYYQVDINLTRQENTHQLLTINLLKDKIDREENQFRFSSFNTNYYLKIRTLSDGTLEIELTDRANYQGCDITKSKIRIVKTNG